MKHLPYAGWGVNATLNSLFLGVIAFVFSASPSLATSQDAAVAPNPATNETTQNAIEQSTLDQAQVRAHTAAMMAQVQGLIDELMANGISGDDAAVLQATKAALAHLSGPEMARVIVSLQQAGVATNARDTTHNSVDAYIAQKGIILQFRLILAEYEGRQAVFELQARFKELTHRQTDTMRTTAEVARTMGGINVSEQSTTDQITQQIVQTDQDAIVNEVSLAGEQLDKAVAGSSEDEAKPLQQAQNDMKSGQVEQTLAQADEDLKEGKVLKALSEQLSARDALRRITLDLNPPTNTVDMLAQTAVDLNRLIEEQKKLLAQTNSVIISKVMVFGLNDQQGVLVDEAYLVQQDMQTLSAPAAGLVKGAIDPPMQTSRAQLHDLSGLPLASTSQETAITKLEEAQKLLQQQLTDARNKQTEEETAKVHEPTLDPSAASGVSEKLTEAEANVITALTETNPPDSNPPSMTEAIKALTKATKNVNDVANTPGLPETTNKAVTEAKTEIEQGKEAAVKGDARGTAAHAGSAMAALTKAQATLALAMARMPGMPGNTGVPMPAPPGSSQPSANSAQTIPGGSNQPGQLYDVSNGFGKFIPEQMRIRVALGQTGPEKRPQEYAPLIDQYLKNLADESTAH